jgi:hypothetical protein
MANITPPSDNDKKFVSQICSNVRSDLIEITEDKLENILLKHLKNLRIIDSWIAPFTIFMTVLLTILTTTFKDSFSISKEVWNAVFLILLLGSSIWLIVCVVKIIKSWDRASTGHIIKQIKDAEEKKS